MKVGVQTVTNVVGTVCNKEVEQLNGTPIATEPSENFEKSGNKNVAVNDLLCWNLQVIVLN